MNTDEIIPELEQVSEPIAQLSVQKTKPKKEKTIEGTLTVDVYQTDSDVVIQSTIAGTKGENLDISITNDMVTIKGVRESDNQIDPNQYYYQELFWGPFSRSIILPEEIDADKATAVYKNGILNITLPKLSKTREKKLRVSS
ncbi:MAG: Hsp20/alpha crystallin family protein [Parcubacteria group bacterium]|nr:Hsp20/alpha crystallin family protein [Parcubacteria group bacterium]